MAVFKAAVVQMRSGTDVAQNIVSMSDLVRQAASQGADYIQTPEMTGLIEQDRDAFFDTITNQSDDKLVAAASELAQELGVTLHIGSTPILVGHGKAANRAFVFGTDGKIRATYDKIHMFDVDLDNGESWRESAVYQAGDKAVQIELCDAQFGLTICYDCRFPELHTTYARNGVDVLTGPSCFTRQTGQAHWHVLLRSRAVETGSFMIAAAQGGDHEDGRETFGHSIIINPWGDVIAELAHEEPGFTIAEIDTGDVAAARQKIPNLVNAKSFSIESRGGSQEQAA